MVQVSIEEAMAKLSDLITQAIEGETVLITEGGNRMVLLMPVAEDGKGKRHFGSAKGLIHIADDFDELLEDFKEYMELTCYSTPTLSYGSLEGTRNLALRHGA